MKEKEESGSMKAVIQDVYKRQMPFFYSISEGISMGVIAYVAMNLLTGKAKEKKISVLMYILAVLFILKYIFL